jgi:hypothetical protein
MRNNIIAVDAKTLLGEFLKEAPKNKGGGDGSNQHRRATRTTKEPVPTPSQEDLLGKGGRKIASEAQAQATLKEQAPDLHEQVRSQQTTVAKARDKVGESVGMSGKTYEKAAALPLASGLIVLCCLGHPLLGRGHLEAAAHFLQFVGLLLQALQLFAECLLPDVADDGSAVHQRQLRPPCLDLLLDPLHGGVAGGLEQILAIAPSGRRRKEARGQAGAREAGGLIPLYSVRGGWRRPGR